MSDIAERLRTAVAEMPHGVWVQWHSLMIEAATEIEGLRRHCLDNASAMPTPTLPSDIGVRG